MSSSLNIPSARPEFDGFGVFYKKRIEPYLHRKERERRRAVLLFIVILAASAFMIASLILYGPFGGDDNIKLSFVVVGLGASGALAILHRARDDIARGLFTRICSRFGFSYRMTLSRPDYYEPFQNLNLLPKHKSESWKDEVRGDHAGVKFVVCEARLMRESSATRRQNKHTVFHGQLYVIDYPRKFLGETVIKRDFGVFNRFTRPGREFSRVGLASSKFEKTFEAWSTDQIEARDLLDPIVLEWFLELERLFNGEKLRAGFTNGQLLIAIESGDGLKMGSMFKSLESVRRIEAILKQFDLIFDLIDVAVGRIDRQIDGAFSLADVRTNFNG